MSLKLYYEMGLAAVKNVRPPEELDVGYALPNQSTPPILRIIPYIVRLLPTLPN